MINLIYLRQRMTFDLFWAAWPNNVQGGYSRKGAKSECLKRWNKHHHDTQADTILKHVAWLKTTPDWLKDNGLYIPAPLVYLNQQRWDGADVPDVRPKAIDDTIAMLNRRDLEAARPSAETRQKLLELRGLRNQ